MIEISHWYENVFLLGFVYLFVAYTQVWSIVIAVIVCLLTYFLEVLIDNNYARMKWQTAINSSWIVCMTFGFVNLLAIYLLKIFGIL